MPGWLSVAADRVWAGREFGWTPAEVDAIPAREWWAIRHAAEAIDAGRATAAERHAREQERQSNRRR